MSCNPRSVSLSAALLALGLAASACGLFSGGGGRPVRVSGNIEVTDVEASFKIPGKVAERLVSEGEAVRKGQVVARLEAGDIEREVAGRQSDVRAAEAAVAELESGSRPEEVAQAAASVERAKASLDDLLAGSRPQEVSAAEAGVSAARADSDHAGLDFARAKALYEKKVVSKKEFDAARAMQDVALNRLRDAEERLSLVKEGPRALQVEQVRRTLQEAEARLALVKKGPRSETVDQARARLETARQALALSQIRLGYAELKSPMDGLVTGQNTESGEYVSPGTPVVTVADISHPWLRAYIDETELTRVKVGQKVQVSTDGYPKKTFAGRVVFLSQEAEFTPKTVQTEKERVKLVYRIKVELDNPAMELKPGMPAAGVIEVE